MKDLDSNISFMSTIFFKYDHETLTQNSNSNNYMYFSNLFL